MKKIVPWHDPNDSNFVRRLKGRIAYLAKPIIKQRQKDEVIERDRLKFASLSVASRCEEIYKKFKLMLKSKRFWTASLWDIKTRFPLQMYSPLRFLIDLNPLIGIKKVNKTCQICAVLVAESLTKKQIETAVRFINGSSLIDSKEDIIGYEDHFFLCSLRRIPEFRLTACFPSAQQTELPTTFTLKEKSTFPESRERKVSIHLISPISSMTQLRTEIKLRAAKLTDKESSQKIYLLKGGYGEPKIQFERK
jgi:hypothetical protein